MMYVEEALISEDRQAAADLATVRIFLDTHGTALANAAYLLGGGAASGSVFCLIDGIRNARRITRTHIARLKRLYALLVLENVGNPERLETALFAEVIPGSKVVEQICLLADVLDDLLGNLGTAAGNPFERGASAISEAA
jgi:hypothetical protein